MNAPELLGEVKAAYRSLGLKPTRRSFFYKRKRAAFACPLTALALYRGAVRRNEPYLGLDTAFNPAFVWACDELGGGFVTGLMDAWDGHEEADDDPEYLDGFAAGRLLAQELLGPASQQQTGASNATRTKERQATDP
jgi:hypothetical protein